MFRKALLANRGDVVIRAFRVVFELGCQTVAVFPFEDRNSEQRLKATKGALMVCKTSDSEAVCEVEGSPISDHKGLSPLGMHVSVPALSAKDIAELAFALRLRVDLMALSFVRSPAGIDLVHRAMDEIPAGRLPVIAKLEKSEAVGNPEAIVLASDGVMVTRGDLGIELPWSGPSRSPGRALNRSLGHPDACLHDRQQWAD